MKEKLIIGKHGCSTCGWKLLYSGLAKQPSHDPLIHLLSKHSEIVAIDNKRESDRPWRLMNVKATPQQRHKRQLELIAFWPQKYFVIYLMRS